ncbi:MAG: amino acid ABC transporter substrate-binding protein [Acidiferrobacter sp.]
MMKLLKDCFTTADGESFDIGRVLWAQGVMVFLGLAIYSVVGQGHPFDMQGFGIGLGATLAAGGAALGLKAKTEPGGST